MLGTLTLYQKSLPILGQKNWVFSLSGSKHVLCQNDFISIRAITGIPSNFHPSSLSQCLSPFPPTWQRLFLHDSLSPQWLWKNRSKESTLFHQTLNEANTSAAEPAFLTMKSATTICLNHTTTTTPITYTTERTTSQTFSLHRTYTTWLEHYTELSMIHFQRKRTVTLST